MRFFDSEEVEGLGMTMQPPQAWRSPFNGPYAFSWIPKPHTSCSMAYRANRQSVDNS